MFDKMQPQKLDDSNEILNHTSIDWDFLIESLEDAKVVLCLGPGVYCEHDPDRLDRKLAAFLRKHQEHLKIRVYDDGWFHYLPGAAKVNAWKQVKRFYQQPNAEVENLLDKIAQIPFHLIINFIPDYKMQEAFNRQNIVSDFLSYIKNVPAKPNIAKPTIQEPLVFNILGEIKNHNSMIMTYTDFYQYLESVFKKNSMPKILQDEIVNETDYLLFLGLPFDKWYFHLFMRMLNQHNEQRSRRYAADLFVEDQDKSYCMEQYTMEFVEKGVEWFVDRLYQECESRDMLRKGNELPIAQIPTTRLREMVVQRDFDQYFDLMGRSLSSFGNATLEEKRQTLEHQTLLEGLKQEYASGRLLQDAYMAGLLNLTKSLLDFLEQLEKKFPDSMK